MPDTSKLEKLNRELEKSEKKLRKAINDEKALQHQLKQLTRKERTHRLCTRGGMLESFLQEPERLTDDDVMLFCSNCGAPLNVSSENFCTNPDCKRHKEHFSFAPGVRFCDQCGKLTTDGKKIEALI